MEIEFKGRKIAIKSLKLREEAKMVSLIRRSQELTDEVQQVELWMDLVTLLTGLPATELDQYRFKDFSEMVRLLLVELGKEVSPPGA